MLVEGVVLCSQVFAKMFESEVNKTFSSSYKQTANVLFSFVVQRDYSEDAKSGRHHCQTRNVTL